MAVGVRARPVGAIHSASEPYTATQVKAQWAERSRYLGHLCLIALVALIVSNVRVHEPAVPALGLALSSAREQELEARAVVGPEPDTHYLESGAVPLTVRLSGQQARAIAEPKRQTRTSVVTYVVQPGDTVLGIAARFGLQGSTLLWSNRALEESPDFLQVGQELNILPIDGAYHTVAKGDTVESVAKAYQVDASAITGYAGNGLTPPYTLTAGQTLIVPGGTKPYVARQVSVSTAAAPKDAKAGTGSFAWPISGSISQTYWEGHRAIDITADTGTPVYSADAGYVAAAQWSNTGYGRMIIIDHGNGYRTLYAHLSGFSVEVGQSVTKGQQIGASGSTGNSTGPHLHFEVMTGETRRNPFNYLP